MVAFAIGGALLSCTGSDSSTATGVGQPTAPAPTPAPTVTPVPTPAPTVTPVPDEPLRLNHVQVIGSHNSYHQRPVDELFAAVEALSPALSQSIDYSHRPLSEQLGSFGIRQFEIDVFADPDGGLYSAPAANVLVGINEPPDPLLLEPGFKVLHTQDFDYATSCLTLVTCLGEIEAWSSDNPEHVPIMIMLEVKSESIQAAAAEADLELPDLLPWTVPLDVTAEQLDVLDAEIRSVFAGEQLITPDDVRGSATSLEAAILADGWPTIEDSRGKVLFTLTGDTEVSELYLAGAPGLAGRVIFPPSTPGRPEAAFVEFNDPTSPGLTDAVEAGYLVRTRTDVPTADARNNDTVRRDQAFASGAHFLSTDYYSPSEYFESEYVVALPGGVVARCNPISAPSSCNAAALTE